MIRKCNKFLLVVLFNLEIFLSVEAKNGEICTTPNGEQAICKSVYDCPHFIIGLKNKIQSQLKFIGESHCGYLFSSPLVCCGQQVDYVPEYDIPMHPVRNPIQLERAKRGYFCRTPNGELATCLSIYDCPLFLRTTQNKIPSQLRFIKNSQCGFDTSPLVCCGTAVNYATVTTESPPEPEKMQLIRRSAISDRRLCGLQASDNNTIDYFIFGGEETELNEFPWMALLGYTNSSGSFTWACGGSLISPNYVLTAAHCTTGVQPKIGKLTHVKLGEHNKDTSIDCNEQGNCNEEPLIVRVKSAKSHKDFNSATKFNDIGIVRLSQKVIFTDFIRPICLPEINEASVAGDILTTAGWGITEHGFYSNSLLKVEVPLVESEDCKKLYSSIDLSLGDSQICAGGKNGKDSCHGDSGGPLMRRSKSNINQWYQEGIISFGYRHCGSMGIPGIYTKVSSFLPWIYNNVKN